MVACLICLAGRMISDSRLVLIGNRMTLRGNEGNYFSAGGAPVTRWWCLLALSCAQARVDGKNGHLFTG